MRPLINPLKSLRLVEGARKPLPTDWRAVLDLCPEDVREAYEERAAIIQFDGREPKKTAERRAFECILSDFATAQDIFLTYCAKNDETGALPKGGAGRKGGKAASAVARA